jgi:glycosyltransferase involved in cell wall biosynthesis
MKLGYLHDSEMPGAEANTVNVAKMCAAFAANGHRPVLVHIAAPGERRGIRDYYGLDAAFRSIGIPVPRWEVRKAIFARLGAWRLRLAGVKLVYGRKPVVLLRAVQAGLPVVIELHALFGADSSRAAFARLLASPKLLRIVVISQALADDLVAEWPAAAGRVVVAHDGADLKPPPAHPVPRPDPSRPCIGYAGHLYPGKGMERIAELAMLRPNIDFLVVGGRPEDVTHWKEATKNSANLHFRGMVPHIEVAAHLAACDLVLAPYAARVQVSDGATDVARWMSPLKIFEYMALGHAIVATDLPVIEEILADGITAALCPAGDTAAWAPRIDALLADPQGTAAMAARARAELAAHYTWQKRAERVLDAL